MMPVIECRVLTQLVLAQPVLLGFMRRAASAASWSMMGIELCRATMRLREEALCMRGAGGGCGTCTGGEPTTAAGLPGGLGVGWATGAAWSGLRQRGARRCRG